MQCLLFHSLEKNVYIFILCFYNVKLYNSSQFSFVFLFRVHFELIETLEFFRTISLLLFVLSGQEI